MTGTWILFGQVHFVQACRGHPHLQATVQHGVGADVCVQGLLVLQLNGMLGVEAEEVNKFCCSVNLRLNHSFTLRDMPAERYVQTS